MGSGLAGVFFLPPHAASATTNMTINSFFISVPLCFELS
jgi:hypothetical protein